MRKINIRRSLECIVLASAAALFAFACTGRSGSTPTTSLTDTSAPIVTLTPLPIPPPPPNLTAFKLVKARDHQHIVFAYSPYMDTETYEVNGISPLDWYLTTGPIAFSSIPSLGNLRGFRFGQWDSDTIEIALDTHSTDAPDTFKTYRVTPSEDDDWQYLSDIRTEYDRDEDGILDSYFWSHI